MKGMLPVHCCCEPGRHLGWMPVEPAHADSGRLPDSVSFRVLRPGTAWACVDPQDSPQAEAVTLRVRMLHVPGRGRHLALDSGHQPLDVLRTLPGWRDA